MDKFIWLQFAPALIVLFSQVSIITKFLNSMMFKYLEFMEYLMMSNQSIIQ